MTGMTWDDNLGQFALLRIEDLLDDGMPLRQGCSGCGGACCRVFIAYPPLQGPRGEVVSEAISVPERLRAAGLEREADDLEAALERAGESLPGDAWLSEGPCPWHNVASGACKFFLMIGVLCSGFEPGCAECIEMRHIDYDKRIATGDLPGTGATR